jgi:small subunit ribosomal protein S8
MSDPIADMLTRIRNGQQAQKRGFDAFVQAEGRDCQVLKDEGYIDGFLCARTPASPSSRSR